MRYFVTLLVVCLAAGISVGAALVEETFTGYPEDSLISASPAGPAVGLTGDWTLDSESDFYVNRTQADLQAGTGKAVYDRPSDDNGTRTATRASSDAHVLYTNDADVFYAAFLIDAPVTGGRMAMGIFLDRLDGAGAPDLAFGIKDGSFIVGNGGTDVNFQGSGVTAGQHLLALRVEYGDADTGPDDNEVVTMWVDPAAESDPAVIDGLSGDFLNAGGGKITGVFMRGEQMLGRPTFFDDLRIGLTFADVMPPLPGDANGDGAVTDADYTIWADNYGATDATFAMGDFNGDGAVTDADYTLWADHYGQTATVPEPAALIALLVTLPRLRRRR
jgi:hypothetical protein